MSRGLQKASHGMARVCSGLEWTEPCGDLTGIMGRTPMGEHASVDYSLRFNEWHRSHMLCMAS